MQDSDIKLVRMTSDGRHKDPMFGFIFAAMQRALLRQAGITKYPREVTPEESAKAKLIGADVVRVLQDRQTAAFVLKYAADPDLDDEYLGFIVVQPETLVYEYVKREYRGDGLEEYMRKSVGLGEHYATHEWKTAA